MNAEFFEAIEDIEKEKGIPRGYMYEKIKQAMLAAFRKDNPECEDNVEIILDEEKKRLEMNVNKTVVEEVELSQPRNYSRSRKEVQPPCKGWRCCPCAGRDEEVRPYRGSGCKAGRHSGHP